MRDLLATLLSFLYTFTPTWLLSLSVFGIQTVMQSRDRLITPFH